MVVKEQIDFFFFPMTVPVISSPEKKITQNLLEFTHYNKEIISNKHLILSLTFEIWSLIRRNVNLKGGWFKGKVQIDACSMSSNKKNQIKEKLKGWKGHICERLCSFWPRLPPWSLLHWNDAEQTEGDSRSDASRFFLNLNLRHIKSQSGPSGTVLLQRRFAAQSGGVQDCQPWWVQGWRRAQHAIG